MLYGMKAISLRADFAPTASRPLLLARLAIAGPVALFLLTDSLFHLLRWPSLAVSILSERRRPFSDFERVRALVSTWADWAAFLLLLTDRWPTIHSPPVQLHYSAPARRFELLFRPFYLLMLLFNLLLFSIPALLALAFQSLSILLLGRRGRWAHALLGAYWSYLIKFKAYGHMATDERPTLFPEEIKTGPAD